MFWWFERNGEYVRCEVLTLSSGDYELRLVGEDGDERAEHFSDAKSLAERQQVVLSELVAEGWTGPHGWVL